MGTVYRASHERLRRPTAIKLLRLVAPDEKTRREAVLRFEREALLTSQLSHPNTIVVYDFGQTESGDLYYAMEYVDGVDLERMVRADGPLPPSRVIHFMLQACASLAEAHACALIHRDIKPANLLVCERGGVADTLKVVDFGLVKNLQAPSISTASVTVGTPTYVAPELILDPTKASRATDVYSLGAVMYWLCTGTTIGDPRGGVAAMASILTQAPPPPSTVRPDLPVDLERVVMRCLERNPFDRPANVLELADELRACRDASGWTHAAARAYWSGTSRERFARASGAT